MGVSLTFPCTVSFTRNWTVAATQRILIAAAASLIATVSASHAQTRDDRTELPSNPIPIPAPFAAASVPAGEIYFLNRAQYVALQQWIRAFTEWRAWDQEWRGRTEPGWFSARKRRQVPAPPDWLFDACRDATDADLTLIDGCRLLTEWKDDYVTANLREQFVAERMQAEAPTRTTWWNHVHVDALWVTPSSPASYGVIGVHVALKVAGRWQVFVAPGAMLMNVATSHGRAWQPATDLGFSYRLVDVTLPGSRRPATLHLNLARAWVLGGSGSVVNSSIDLAGLSLTFK